MRSRVLVASEYSPVAVTDERERALDDASVLPALLETRVGLFFDHELEDAVIEVDVGVLGDGGLDLFTQGEYIGMLYLGVKARRHNAALDELALELGGGPLVDG